MRALFTSILSLSFLAACSAQDETDAGTPSMTWWVESEASMLTFASTKNSDITEEHEISGIEGSMTEDGEVRIRLDMSTVETFIPIRNERVAEFLFETADYPVATITADLDYGEMSLETGDTEQHEIAFQLTLRDVTVDLSANVEISRLEEGRVRVHSTEPIEVHAMALELMDGIDTLQELAGLDSITREVPVRFVIEFTRN